MSKKMFKDGKWLVKKKQTKQTSVLNVSWYTCL